MAVLTPLLVWASQRCLASMFNSPILWVPKDFRQRREYDWFREAFSCQDLLVASWQGCTLDDPRLPRFAEALLSPADPKTRRRNRELFDRVITGPDMFERLTPKPLELSPATAAARLRGTFLGPDGRASCALVVFTEEGGYHRHESLQVIRPKAAFDRPRVVACFTDCWFASCRTMPACCWDRWGGVFLRKTATVAGRSSSPVRSRATTSNAG